MATDGESTSIFIPKRARGYKSPPELLIVQHYVAIVMRSVPLKVRLYCHSWVHASCVGLEDKQYKQLTQLTSQVENLAYYCKLNQCGVGRKKFLHEILNKAVEGEDTPSIRSLQQNKLISTVLFLRLLQRLTLSNLRM